MPPPTSLMQRAQQQLHSAQAAKATEYAASDLTEAEQQFQAAQAAMAAKEYATAQDAAEAAQVTARLAQVRAELVVARQEINTRSAENVRLRRELLTAHTTPAHGGGATSTTAQPAAGFTPVPDGSDDAGASPNAGNATEKQP